MELLMFIHTREMYSSTQERCTYTMPYNHRIDETVCHYLVKHSCLLALAFDINTCRLKIIYFNF